MRYGSFCIMACLLAVSVSFGRNAVTLVDERGGEIILNFTLPQYDVSDVVVNGEVCNFIRVPGSIYPAEKGFPNLPRISGSLVIPNNAAMGLEIVDIQYKEVNVKRIMPSRGRIYRHQDPEDIPYSFGKIYTEDKWYPETAAFLGDPFIMRDVRGITVYFHPVSYNPAQGKVKIAESITVKVKNTGPGKVNVLRTTKRLVSPAYEKIYNRHFLNYADNRSRYTPVDDGDKMIVISPSSFLSAMEPFVEWKNKKGIQTEIFEYPDETGGSGSDNIQNFIQQKYDDDNITYILLVGDHDDLPSVIISNSSYISGADPAYTFLDGKDSYPDAFIGRFSSSNASDIETMVNKTLTYEKEPESGADWYHKATGLGSEDENFQGIKDWEYMDIFRDSLLNYNYTEVDQIYDPGAEASDLSSAINSGRGWINYMGHGNYMIWGTSNFRNTDISQLSNGNKLPIIVSVSCLNGQFNNHPYCFAEMFLKESNKGAVLFHGASNSQAWEPPQQAMEEMINILIADTYISTGAILVNGMMYMVDTWGVNYPELVDTTIKCWNIFGDPSLMPFTDTPVEITVDHPSQIPQGTTTVEIGFGKEVLDGRVCLFHADSGIAGRAILSDASSVKIDADVPAAEKITIVVTARNKLPYEAEINVGPSGIGTVSNSNMNLKMQAFPNPFRAVTNITFNNPAKNALVTIYSSAGKVLVSERVTGSSFSWDAKNQTSGLYIVRVRTNNNVVEKDICLIK